MPGTTTAMPDMLDTERSLPRPDGKLTWRPVPFAEMSETGRKTLLEPGHEAEWARLNREKQEYHHRRARAMTPSERVAAGQKLSKQAVSLLASSIRSGNVPLRAFWS